MSKEKAIEKIDKSIDILKWYRVSKNEKNKAICFLREALEELEDNMEQNNKQTMPCFELGNLYVFKEEDEDGELTIIGKLIAKNESQDTLTFGNQYEIETENFVTDQAFDLRISVNKDLREITFSVPKEDFWKDFPTQSPLCRRNDGIPFDVDRLTISFPKWRAESIKAYGNAWVPQVAYKIFRAIEAEEKK